MGLVPFAFSVHQIVSSVGADVGFAAIVGLAILVLLYFAQARETANLRDRAHEAAQRVEQLEARVAQVARRQPVPAVVQPPPAVAASIGASRVLAAPVSTGLTNRVAAPGAPAGVGAPALAAATRLIPGAVPAMSQSSPVTPPVVPAMSQGSTAPPEVPATPVGSVGDRAPVPGPAEADRASIPTPGEAGPQAPQAAPVTGFAYAESAAVPPATFAGTGNGSPREHGANTAVAGRGSARPAERPPVRQISPTPPRRPLLAKDEPPPRSRLRLLAALLVGAAAAALVVFAVVHFTSAGASSSTGRAAHTSTVATHGRHHGTAVNPSSVTVAVLNGTSTPDLATHTATRLAALGYHWTVADAAVQTYTSSVVEFMPGHRAEALAVARALKLTPSSVQPVDSTTQAVACPQTPCSATVVVTTGADIASQ